jgi:hypothetical protein
LSVNGNAILGGDATIAGNLTVNGTLTTVNSETISVVDPIFELHTGVDSATLTVDDGKDIGLKMDYYKGSAKSAFVGWTNDSGYLEYYANATETAGVISGDYGTIKGLSYISTVATGTAPFTVNSSTQVANLYATNANTVTASSQPNITSVGTLVSLSVTGALSAATLTGNGVTISNIAGANVSGIVANANMSAYAGNVTVASQPNITSVGTLTSLSVSGNGEFNSGTNGLVSINPSSIEIGSVDRSTTGPAFIDFHSSTGASDFDARIIATGGNTSAGFGNIDIYSANTTLHGDLFGVNETLTGNLAANIITVGPSVTIASNGSVTATTFYGNVVGRVDATIVAPGSNTYVLINDAGNIGASAKFTFDKASNVLTVLGNIVSTNANLGNAASANYFVGNGIYISNIAGPNVSGFVPNADFSTNANMSAYAGNITVSAQPNVTSVGTLTSLTIAATGSVSGANLVSANYFTGTLTTAAQPNITSVGTLTSVAVSGNAVLNTVKVDTGLSSNRATVTVAGSTIIDQFPTTSYRGAKYVITGKSDNGYQSAEVLLVHTGTQSYITIYGYLTSGTSDVFDVTSNVDVISGNVRLYASNVTTNTSLNLVATYVQD